MREINNDKIKACNKCKKETEKWVTEYNPPEKFKDWCEECYLKEVKYHHL